jgi:hypothetical protein
VRHQRLFTSEHLNHRKTTVSELKAQAKARQPLPVLAPGSIAAVPPISCPDGKKPSPGGDGSSFAAQCPDKDGTDGPSQSVNGTACLPVPPGIRNGFGFARPMRWAMVDAGRKHRARCMADKWGTIGSPTWGPRDPGISGYLVAMVSGLARERIMMRDRVDRRW